MTIKLTLKPREHPDEDVFERYAFGRLPEKEATAFEEHLLICEHCQTRLEETEDHIRLMKAGAAAYIVEHKGDLAGHFRDPGLRWSGLAACLILLTCMGALLSWRRPMAEPQVVVLDAYRGAASEAPAGQPLDLKIDLKDVANAVGYRVEVVDATGRRVWFGGTPARLAKGLSPGVYWIRLSTDGGEPLREYGLSIVRSK